MDHDKLLSDLFTILREELYVSRSTTEEIQFSIERQSTRCEKRAEFKASGLRQKAFEDFIHSNSLVGNVDIRLDRELINNAKYFITVVLERFAKKLDPESIQQTFRLDNILDYWVFGPGTSNGISATHTAEKIYLPMHCTQLSQDLVSYLRRYHPYLYLFDKINENIGRPSLIQGSRLSTVRKNREKDRTIAIEPSGNMCLQLAAGYYLSDVLRSIGLDLATQQAKNKHLACFGSKTGSLATIDLSNASDMIKPELVELLMPKPWFSFLMAARSHEIKINETWHTMNMMSTMGNGFTFQLMTLIIIALLYGYRCTRKGPNLFMDWSRSAVYGDDIIIPTDEYEGFTAVLEAAGLLVNHEKSYFQGPFRESCGGDYYNGIDVTPIYIRRLNSDPSIYVAINQLFNWMGKNQLLLPSTLQYLGSLLRKGPYLVPEWMNPDQGVQTSGCGRRFKYLQPLRVDKKIANDFFIAPLAAGGYIRSTPTGAVYTPRPYKTRYVTRRGRLPQGYLSGFCPLRGGAISTFVETFTFLLK